MFCLNSFLYYFHRRALSEMDMEDGGYQHLEMSEDEYASEESD